MSRARGGQVSFGASLPSLAPSREGLLSRTQNQNERDEGALTQSSKSGRWHDD